MWADLEPPYTTICADPAWPLRWSGGAGGRRARATSLGYTLMTVDQIEALPVGDLTATDAHLYLWVTPQLHREGIGCAVARAWGFEPVDEIIWRKRNFGTGALPGPYLELFSRTPRLGWDSWCHGYEIGAVS